MVQNHFFHLKNNSRHHFEFSRQVLISRNYKGDLETNVIDKFNSLLLEREEENNTTPVIQTEGVTFAYIKHNNVYCILSLLIKT